jgi:hypothetical protein
MLQYHILAVIIGCIVDFFLGDPHSFPHPVIAIGKLITWLEGYLRNGFPKGEKGEKQAGVVLVVLVPGITAMVAGGILYLFYRISPWMGVIAESLICYQMMAWRSLRKESMKVYHALKNRDTEGARTAVSMIVGRDTTTLTEEGIIKAPIPVGTPINMDKATIFQGESLLTLSGIDIESPSGILCKSIAIARVGPKSVIVKKLEPRANPSGRLWIAMLIPNKKLDFIRGFFTIISILFSTSITNNIPNIIPITVAIKPPNINDWGSK